MQAARIAAVLALISALAGHGTRAEGIDGIVRIIGADPAPRSAPYLHPTYGSGDLGFAERAEPGLGREFRPPSRETRTEPRSTAIDPVRDPDWYLRDPTLQPGDIVVLAGEVLMFRGGTLPYGRADFVPLQSARIAPGEKARIAAMTGLAPDAPIAGAERSAARAGSKRPGG